MAPPDSRDRNLIRTALDETLLVEAGAGSGKTTALVDRMLRLIAGGHATADEIAAVTFTRKAAGELRQRFQERLERALADGRIDDPDAATPIDDEVMGRLRLALTHIDRAFMGTIHAFCARLLRERPLDAKLDPSFRELTAPEERTLARQFWDQYLERLTAQDEGDSLLGRLDDLGIRPSQLYGQYLRMNEASDVHFPVDEAPPPDASTLARVRAELESIVDDAIPGIPTTPPDRGWDSLQRKLLRIRYLRAALDFSRPAALFEALDTLCTSKKAGVTYKRWIYGTGQVKDIEARVNALIQVTPERPEPPALRLLADWRAHRYGPVLELVQGAARAFGHHRRQTAQLTFHDLLSLATALLRSSPSAREGLGLRWRRILVDEFQDTDPLQAELLFLLASDPAQDPPGGGWAHLVPRPGALFVVGDPKQSIYRFRRADISLYSRVRERFETFGRVVRLTANFRSTEPIGDIVTGVFSPEPGLGEGRFPDDGTDRQAGYAPLLTQPRTTAAPREGVFTYHIPREHSRASAALRWEAGALATWVADRIDDDRRPEDFLILTRTRRHLAAYARALEARNVPVLVSGSGVGIEDELRELRIVLECLVDPGDALAVLAALEGLFFGLDPHTLLEHVEAGGTFDYRRPDRQPPGRVSDALRQLQTWWELAAHRAADEVVERIVSSVGLLPFAASGELGGLRAGALAFTMELVRTTAVADDASLAGALDAIGLVLDEDDTDVEAPLEPARGGEVRLMNLHKAKGLEAPVVVLAGPYGTIPMGRSMIVERDADGVSLGWCVVEEKRGRHNWNRVAAPRDWDSRDARERAFGEAEEDRLLYVAVTRAADELVVGCQDPEHKRGGRGPWAGLEPWLDQHAEDLAIAPREVPGRRVLPIDVDTLRAREAEVALARDRAGEAGWTFRTVTALVRSDAPLDPEGGDLFDIEAADEAEAAGLGWTQSTGDSTGPGGFTWGNAVHITLEAALRGLDGDALTGVARTALLENDRPVSGGEPIELEALLVLVERIQGSDLWRRALLAETTLTEHAFVMERSEGDYLEGVIDLAFRESDGWVIVDYKTAADDRAFALRLPHYQQQVALYAEAWSRLTGEAVKEALVWRVG